MEKNSLQFECKTRKSVGDSKIWSSRTKNMNLYGTGTFIPTCIYFFLFAIEKKENATREINSAEKGKAIGGM